MLYNDNEDLRYDKDIERGHRVSITVEDEEITPTSSHEFIATVYNATTGTEVCDIDYELDTANNQVSFTLASTQTASFTSGDNYRYEIKYKSTTITDWEPYMWGYVIIYDSGVVE